MEVKPRKSWGSGQFMETMELAKNTEVYLKMCGSLLNMATIWTIWLYGFQLSVYHQIDVVFHLTDPKCAMKLEHCVVSSLALGRLCSQKQSVRPPVPENLTWKLET